MASIIIDIRDKIKGILEAIVEQGGTTPKISIVYTYPESNPTGYPYAWIDYKGDISRFLNNKEDLIEYTFEVNLIQEKLEDFKGRAEAEDISMERSFDINEAFRDSNNLGMTGIIMVNPIEIIKSYIDNATRIALKVVLKVLTKEGITVKDYYMDTVRKLVTIKDIDLKIIGDTAFYTVPVGTKLIPVGFNLRSKSIEGSITGGGGRLRRASDDEEIVSYNATDLGDVGYCMSYFPDITEWSPILIVDGGDSIVFEVQNPAEADTCIVDIDLLGYLIEE